MLNYSHLSKPNEALWGYEVERAKTGITINLASLATVFLTKEEYSIDGKFSTQPIFNKEVTVLFNSILKALICYLNVIRICEHSYKIL